MYLFCSLGVAVGIDGDDDAADDDDVEDPCSASVCVMDQLKIVCPTLAIGAVAAFLG